MTTLSVNLNKVALIRNARGGGRPDVTDCARWCLEAGAGGLTLHPRPDGRHALASDVVALREIAVSAGAEMNVEGNPFAEPAGGYPGLLAIVREARPTQVTLVPDAPGQLTSDHGWDLPRETERLRPILADLHDLDCRVSLFVDASATVVRAAADTGADRVELYTGPFAEAVADGAAVGVLPRYIEAARVAREVGIGLNAGHDLNLDNLALLLSEVPGIEEVSIGQALIADALRLGLSGAVRAYLDAIGS